MIRAAQGTSREGQNPAQEARAHFCVRSAAAGVPPLRAVLRDSWDEFLLPPPSSPAGVLRERMCRIIGLFPFRKGHARPVEVNRRPSRDYKGRTSGLRLMGVTKDQKPAVNATRCQSRVGVVLAGQSASYCGPEGSGLNAGVGEPLLKP